MDKETEAIINEALATMNARGRDYERARNYYKGNHNLTFASQQFRSAFGETFRSFADNLMPPVVDAVKDSLTVTGFQVEAGDESIANTAWKIWQRNRMNLRAGEVHKEAALKGDSYVMVWADALGRAALHPQKAHLCVVNYSEDDAGVATSAVKAWLAADKTAYITVYFSDRIEKYVSRTKHTNGFPSSAKMFVERKVAGERFPLLNPYGVVPVFHFANNASMGEGGRSELADVMPLQDALNKAILDKMVAMEYTAFTQRYAIGLDVETDPLTGKPLVPFSGMERWLTVADEKVKFGQFEGANLEQFLKVQTEFRIEIARVSGTPLTYFFLQNGNVPSGEALKNLEKRFNRKIADRQASFGQSWEDAMGLALRIESGNATSDLRLFTQWADPSPSSQKETLESLILKQSLGVDEETLLMECGYGVSDIAAMMTRKRNREREAQREFDAGELIAA